MKKKISFFASKQRESNFPTGPQGLHLFAQAFVMVFFCFFLQFAATVAILKYEKNMTTAKLCTIKCQTAESV